MPEIVTSPGLLGLTALLAYLLGSIPFGLVITRLMGLGDLRKIGSGNIGATNVLRTGSKGAALATLALDAGKGGIAVLIAGWLVGSDAAQVAALASFLGHLFPVWLGFRGGKGVATCLGILLALSWPVGLSVCATWLATAVLSRISSLGALVASASTALWLLVYGRTDLFALALALTALIFIRHAANIRRILAGTESKIGAKKS
jgi:acyl phosphate:glycerol-3-phosphate acyltransferase